MIRMNLTKLKTIDMKTVKIHGYYIDKYYDDILVYCCKYVSRNGGKFQRMWKEEYLSMGIRSHIRFKIKG